MNREILFRGKRKDNGEWVYGDAIHFQRLENGNWIDLFGIQTIFDYWEIIPETLGQFTGLHDKNGTKIFEGDICKLNNEIYVVEFGEYHNGESYEDAVSGNGWYIRPIENKANEYGEIDGVYALSNGYEVIGNIHEEDNNGTIFNI